MSKRSEFVKSAKGFVAGAKRSAKNKGRKINLAQIRHDCLDLALDILWLGDFPYPDHYVRVYETMCVEFETVRPLPSALTMTILSIASDNKETRESEVDRVIKKALDRMDAMMSHNKSK